MNIYQQNNPQYFNELKILVENNPKHYSKMLKSTYKYILDWMNFQLSLLDESYNISTKCYWILNNLQQFPKCKKCGKPMTKHYVKISKGYKMFCSNQCATHSIERQLTRKQTCLKKYGVEHFSKTENYKKHMEKVFEERYNGCPFSKKSTIYSHLYDKLSEQEHKKITNCSQVKSIANKALQTKRQRYGRQCCDIEKSRQTCLKNHGVEYGFKSKNAKESYLKKFGVDNVFKLKYIQDKCRMRYTYDNVAFDSAPEIAFYIWLSDNNIHFEYQPNITFEYEFEGKKHFYMPDFLVENQLIELKGNHFLNEDGTWKNPYDSSQNGLFEAKHQCLIKNNVKILYETNYKKYLDYIVQKYGKDYLKKFKNN